MYIRDGSAPVQHAIGRAGDAALLRPQSLGFDPPREGMASARARNRSSAAAPATDPTVPIVRREWSEWMVFLDAKGLFSQVPGSAPVVPYEIPGTARPAIYEIGRRKGTHKPCEVLYLGTTTSPSEGVRNRLIEHASIDGPLYDRIVEGLIRRYEFVVRFVRFAPEEAAEAERVATELRARLHAARYPWNPG